MLTGCGQNNTASGLKTTTTDPTRATAIVVGRDEEVQINYNNLEQFVGQDYSDLFPSPVAGHCDNFGTQKRAGVAYVMQTNN